jgi:hypothetical protein
MGNRAVITTKEQKIGVYLHWNGGRDSIEGFLAVCKDLGHRPPEQDCYGWARLCQVIGNFFGDTTSIGIDTLDRLDCDNGDNGMYIIENWDIVERKFIGEYFKEQNEYSLEDMKKSILVKQPK